MQDDSLRLLDKSLLSLAWKTIVQIDKSIYFFCSVFFNILYKLRMEKVFYIL